MEPFEYHKPFLPTIKEEDIPKFDSWWEKKITKDDPWRKYLNKLSFFQEAMELEEKINNGEVSKFDVTIEYIKEMTVIADDAKSARKYAESYDFDEYDFYKEVTID